MAPRMPRTRHLKVGYISGTIRDRKGGIVTAPLVLIGSGRHSRGHGSECQEGLC